MAFRMSRFHRHHHSWVSLRPTFQVLRKLIGRLALSSVAGSAQQRAAIIKPGVPTETMRLISRATFGMAAAAVVLLGACNRGSIPSAERSDEPEAVTVDIAQPKVKAGPGTTPMAERVAVIGLLNKRNGIERDLTMKPGQAFKVGDVVVRLRACETTAPWEEQKLTGAFVQLDVRNPQGAFQRVFSGWLYKETPSINVVEHPVYDVWPKSCKMTHPDADASTVRAGSADKSKSSAPKSTPGGAGTPANETTPAEPAAPSPADTPTTASADSATERRAR
jgi:hypothetical protein